MPEVKFRTAASDSNINSYSLAFNRLGITTAKILYQFAYQYYWLQFQPSGCTFDLEFILSYISKIFAT